MDFLTRLFISLAVLIMLIILVAEVMYRLSAYYQVTKKGMFATFCNKECCGEFMTYKRLKHFEGKGAKFLFNAYIPTSKDTHDADVMMFTKHGIVMVKCMNYRGQIVGNDRYRFWTQTLPAGRHKSEKTQFFNPLWQNLASIDALNSLLAGSVPLFNVVAFSDRCTLKDVTVTSPFSHVTTLNELPQVVKAILEKNPEMMPQEDVDSLWETLLPLTDPNEAPKLLHVHSAECGHKHH